MKTQPRDIPFRDRLTCTVREAVSATGLCRDKIFELLHDKKIDSTMVGRLRLIRVASLIALLEPAE